MIPSKSKGWMVNFSMRRVEPIEAEESPYNRNDYGRYRGPKRTYMLHDDQVFATELEALVNLQARMANRYGKLAKQLTKYKCELDSVAAAAMAAFRRAS